MLTFTFVTFIFVILSLTPIVLGINLKSAYELYDDVFANYTSDIRPVHNDSEVMHVYVSAHLVLVLRVDEVSGEVSMGLSIAIYWEDKKLRWDPWKYEMRSKIEVDVSKIWKPPLKLTSPSQKAERIVKDGDMAIVYSHGHVFLGFNDIFHSSCPIQTTYFPFDMQKCAVWFSAPEYGQRLKYIAVSPVLNTEYYFENAIWSLEKTELTSFTMGDNENLVCGVHLRRRATFHILNLLTPIVILMLLNSMVFVLPVESGERVGFSVTLLLSVAVYMTIISDKLPNASKPTPILMYVLVAYLAQSSLICLTTLLGLRFYFDDDDEPVSSVWFNVARTINCCPRKTISLTGKVCETKDMEFANNVEDVKNTNPCDDEDGREMSWKMVAKTFDIVFLVFNITLCFAITAIYLVLVHVQPF